MYAMVLGITMLITVIGIGALATSRVTSRATSVSTDWVEAGDIAFSAAEHAVAAMNAAAATSPTTWRDAAISGQTFNTFSFGRGTLKSVMVDEGDGLLSDDYSDAIKLYGIGIMGTTKRVYSVQLNATGEGVDALKTAMHAAGGIVLNGTSVVFDGPISTNGNLVNAANLKGLGTTEVAGTGGTLSPAKPMPPVSVFDTYKARATTISSSYAADGNLLPGTLSAADNPYGAENPDGIYYLRLPDTISTLLIDRSYIKGTLLVEAAAGSTNQTLVIDDEIFWEPHSTQFASLITKGIRTININGTIATYGGRATELRGLIHTIGSTNVNLNDAAFINGCILADGTITTTGSVGITATPSLFTTPPMGYTKGNKIIPLPGSWKWDSPPPGH
jgi:hypothetical protein